jgi:hypothetical protein
MSICHECGEVQVDVAALDTYCFIGHSSVPEPGTLALIVLGLLELAGMRLRAGSGDRQSDNNPRQPPRWMQRAVSTTRHFL